MDVKRQTIHLMFKYIQNEHNLNLINQLAIKSIHTINIQSYEYNYNKIYRTTQAQSITINAWSIIHINTFAIKIQ